MPLYFSSVAPTCPISKDSPVGPDNPYKYHRKDKIQAPIGHAVDLSSAIALANRLRQIMLNIINNPVRNNVHPGKQGKENVGKDKFKNKTARWVEQKSKRVKKKFKYYGITDSGERDRNTYVVTERIVRMVWYDKAWKTYLIWDYGEKGEGEPLSDSSAGE